MAKIMSARQAGEELDLTHTEVIRRIRKADILARKMGWNWVVTDDEVTAVRNKDWYKKLMTRRTAA
jgi:hypothetical protein